MAKKQNISREGFEKNNFLVFLGLIFTQPDSFLQSTVRFLGFLRTKTIQYCSGSGGGPLGKVGTDFVEAGST